MTSKRKSEGIALLSLYNDEGDEEDDEEEAADEQENQVLQEKQQCIPQKETVVESVYTQPRVEASETAISSFAVPFQHEDVFCSSPVVDQAGNGAHGMIVDYDHDDGAMSPDAEGGERMSTGRTVFGSGMKARNGATLPSTEDITKTGNVPLHGQSLPTPNQEPAARTPPATESLDVQMSECKEPAKDSSDDDILADFLPPPPMEKCSQELQNKFAKYLALKEAGRSFNEDLRKSKDYRNPDFLQRAVMYQEIDQIGSYFKKELALEFRREQERREQAKKQSQRIDFTQGGVQASPGPALSDKAKPVLPIVSEQRGSASVDASVAGSQAAPESAPKSDTARSNKKSKWDKVDDSRVTPILPAAVTKPALAATNAHAVFAVASAGGVYASFAQQKRKEAEERSRGSDKKGERK